MFPFAASNIQHDDVCRVCVCVQCVQCGAQRVLQCCAQCTAAWGVVQQAASSRLWRLRTMANVTGVGLNVWHARRLHPLAAVAERKMYACVHTFVWTAAPYGTRSLMGLHIWWSFFLYPLIYCAIVQCATRYIVLRIDMSCFMILQRIEGALFFPCLARDIVAEISFAKHTHTMT